MKYVVKCIVFALILQLVACHSEATKTITIKDKYEISLPSNLSKRDDLNADASLQYGNPFTELYTIVIDETVTQMFAALQIREPQQQMSQNELFASISLEDYFDTYCENVEGLQISQGDFKKTTINNFPAYYIEKEAMAQSAKIFYNIAILKGEKAFYQVCTWTLAQNKEKNKKAMEKIIYSFKEI